MAGPGGGWRERTDWADTAARLGGRQAPSARERVFAAAVAPYRPRVEQLAGETAEAERSLRAYTEQAWSIVAPNDRFVPGYHVDAICEHLQALAALQIRNLVIEMPFRHGKSILSAVMFPTWWWVTVPGVRFIYTSYADDFTVRDHNRCRTVVTSHWYQARWQSRFRVRKATDDRIENDREGFRIATSVSGLGTGEGAECFVMDDLMKTQEAHSPAKRRDAIRYLTETVPTRYHDPATFRKLLVGHRIHGEDPAGHLRATQPGVWQFLTLPFEYDPRRYSLPIGNPSRIELTALQDARPELCDPRTEMGEVMWPARYPDEAAVRAEKASVSAFAWAAQANQNPVPEEGNMFNVSAFRGFRGVLAPEVGAAGRLTWQLHLLVPDHDGTRPVVVRADECRWFQTIDTAVTAKAHSDYTAISTFALTPRGELCLWHVGRWKLEVPDQWEAIKRLRDGPAEWDESRRTWRDESARWPRELIVQAVENKQSGTGLLQQAARAGRPLHALDPGKNDKVQRCSDIIVMVQNGLVYLREGAAWRPDFDSEVAAFPGGAHDDQIDTLAYAGIMVRQGHWLTRGFLSGDILVSAPGEEDNGVLRFDRDRDNVVRVAGVEIDFGDD
jgi:predicted phage terminase large subunit-like protein